MVRVRLLENHPTSRNYIGITNRNNYLFIQHTRATIESQISGRSKTQPPDGDRMPRKPLFFTHMFIATVVAKEDAAQTTHCVPYLCLCPERVRERWFENTPDIRRWKYAHTICTREPWILCKLHHTQNDAIRNICVWWWGSWKYFTSIANYYSTQATCALVNCTIV